ncbi:copper chaperone [Natronocella acetinitrilica]|uniref:Copper chaperone n=1 Tax=Natronocella acetinitrilica TaxID=414046 RepID=A0AAE3G4B9_9GAMM|nr:heavy-metal-associated domain-containing protein [Natronocella acetinitrilica]MCP1674849.1 copper chaperone [Natronocella acetinitrilica]
MIRIRVTGMTCGHCEASVREALAAVPGVDEVTSVDRAQGQATVTGAADTAALIAAVRQRGFEASEIRD